MNAESRRAALLERFVATWANLDGLRVRGNDDPAASDLITTSGTPSGDDCWRPLLQKTDSSLLEAVYAKLPARFPLLYEQLVLTYRWAEVDLKLYRLIGNPPGPDLSGLLGGIHYDRFLSPFLLRNGFIPFGKGPDIDYDPVCFDLTRRRKNREFMIVKLDHEEILCNERIKVVAQLAPTFQQLVLNTIDAAGRM